jgi:phosphoribosyl-ATP pyrophosphohydrolase/phosphoribosyl-AMP cyclohydrolase
MVSCFARTATAADVLATVGSVIRERAADRGNSGDAPTYTQRLLADRNLRLKKIGEEAAEFVTACADGQAERAVDEAADLFYHTLVALQALGVGLDEVRATLAARR